MKKIFSLILMVLLIPMIANAEGAQTITEFGENTNASTNVTVGNVEAPVYEVNIGWYDLEFNWVYNSSSQLYEWSNKNGAADISITDKSIGGYVVPSVVWTPTAKYDFTIGTLKYTDWAYCDLLDAEEYAGLTNGEEPYTDLYKNSSCTGEKFSTATETFQENTYYAHWKPEDIELQNDGVLPSEARGCQMGTDENENCSAWGYEVFLYLGVDRTKTITTPTTGDTIGTITVSLTTH